MFEDIRELLILEVPVCFDLALYSPYLLKMCIKIFADEMTNNMISGISFKIIKR